MRRRRRVPDPHDLVPEAARLTKDTVLVGPGEGHDVVRTAHNRGRWLMRCDINHHITNDGARVDDGRGMTMISTPRHDETALGLVRTSVD
jgi:FtsP/CotA-like multicopper oxidase with cupredoxin domain